MSFRHAIGHHQMQHYHCAIEGTTTSGVYYRFCIDHCAECDRKQVTSKYPRHEWINNPAIPG